MSPGELLEKLLALRGFADPVARETFLHPKYEDMHDPFLMNDMDKAVERIFAAIKAGEKICVYSDYDADGIPGAVILHDFFKKIGYTNFCNYIPHRHNEGYGVHKEALQSLRDDGAKVVITVDVGITAIEEIAFGSSLDLDIIVTDHHEPLEVIPDCVAVVNPKLGSYPDTMLCGAGVAFKLVQAMLTTLSFREGRLANQAGCVWPEVPSGWEKWLLDMAGLATLSDMVPLLNENRIIAYYGMKVLQQTRRPGLQALFQKSGISLAHLCEDDITFSITPKLNAASRMAHPVDAFKALATSDIREGLVAAEHLASLNDDRKKTVATIMREAHKRIAVRTASEALPKILVIGDPMWSAGVLGLVASKIAEEYSVTTFVWGSEEDLIKGSCRGIGDVPVVKLMREVSHLLVQFGGHDEAGGFTVTRETVHFLEEALCKSYGAVKHEVSRRKDVSWDMELELSDVTMKHYQTLREMAPFGVGNPKPVFAFKNALVKGVKQFGKTTEHLEVLFPGVRAISWYAKPDSFTEFVEVGKQVTLLAEFDYSVFRGKSELRLKIVDVLP
jgi:single-stranded-DNA-specific exonuclease